MSQSEKSSNGNGQVSTPVSQSQSVAQSAASTPFISSRSLESSILAQRLLFSRQIQFAGYNQQFGGKRDLNLILGYDDFIDISSYRYEYERGGIAKRIVEFYPKASWSTGFDILEDKNLKRKTPFEKAHDSLVQKFDLYQELIRASILAFIGHFSIILIGAPGDPSTEIDRGNGSLDNIAYLMPLGEDKVRIERVYGQDPNDNVFSPRFGLPEYYYINLNGYSSRTSLGYLSGQQLSAAASLSGKRVHWSRIIHITHDSLDNKLIGQPFLKAIWNYLADHKKIAGGGAEAQLRRAWPGLHADIDKDLNATPEERAAMGDQLDDYNIGLRNAIRTRGVDINPLVTTGQINIKENSEANLQLISGTTGIPMSVLSGSSAGGLAVGEVAGNRDRNITNDRISEVRTSHCIPTLKTLLGRLSTYGYLPVPRNPLYKVVVPSEEEMSEPEKAKNISVIASANQSLHAAGLPAVMSTDEIRDRFYPDLGPVKVVEEEKVNKEDDSNVVSE